MPNDSKKKNKKKKNAIFRTKQSIALEIGL